MALDSSSISQWFCAEISQNIQNGGATFSELLFPKNEKESWTIYRQMSELLSEQIFDIARISGAQVDKCRPKVTA